MQGFFGQWAGSGVAGIGNEWVYRPIWICVCFCRRWRAVRVGIYPTMSQKFCNWAMPYIFCTYHFPIHTVIICFWLYVGTMVKAMNNHWTGGFHLKNINIRLETFSKVMRSRSLWLSIRGRWWILLFLLSCLLGVCLHWNTATVVLGSGRYG